MVYLKEWIKYGLSKLALIVHFDDVGNVSDEEDVLPKF